MKKSKKLIKYLGNFLMFFGLFFVFIKLADLDIDYSVITEENNILILLLLTLLYGLNILFLTIPWRNYLKIITNIKIEFTEISYIYTKSNIMKYIPGNVFQYVGRNELAVRNNLKHADVGLSTVLETLSLSLAALLCAVIYNTRGFLLWLSEYGHKYLVGIFILIAVLVIAVLMLIKIFRNTISSYIERYVKLINEKNASSAIINVLIGMIQHTVFAILFLVILVNIVNTTIELSNIPIIVGGYLLSWLVGYLTIGSPGGIGVRELVICLLLDGVVPQENVLLAIILFRLVSILGDIVALAYAIILNRINNHMQKKSKVKENFYE